MRGGLLLILSAPSGAGKTTLAHMLLREFGENALFSVSTTTRPPRGREVDKVDYHFVDQDTFKAMVDRGEFVEWAEVHGQWYGTHKSYIEQMRLGKIVIFDIDVQGGTTIHGKHADAASVFILPPSVEELERRLRERRTDSEDVIRRRMMAARAEMERGCASYDYLIVNQELERAYANLKSIVLAERCRRGRVDLTGLGLDD
jgi:guanylate kinase